MFHDCRNLSRSVASRWMLVAGLLLGAAPAALAEPAATVRVSDDPLAIMLAVYHRNDGNHESSRIQLVVRDRLGHERTRVIRRSALDFDGGTKHLLFFESPADVKDTGLLTVDYDDERDDEQWLRLARLRKTMRIAEASKSGSFMGTDFSYSDLTRLAPRNYSLKLLEKSTQTDGEDCWLVEARPKTERAKQETAYVKQHLWISKQSLLPLRMKAWMDSGQKIKFIRQSQISQVGGVWIARRVVAKTFRNNTQQSETIMNVLDVGFDKPEVTDALFTKRRLEQGL